MGLSAHSSLTILTSIPGICVGLAHILVEINVGRRVARRNASDKPCSAWDFKPLNTLLRGKIVSIRGPNMVRENRVHVYVVSCVDYIVGPVYYGPPY